MVRVMYLFLVDKITYQGGMSSIELGGKLQFKGLYFAG